METTTVAAATPANDGAAERGRSRAVRRKTRPQAQKKYTDDLLRQVHAEYWNSLDTISATARRWNISQSTLSDRWRALDLPVATGANRFARRLRWFVVPIADCEKEEAAGKSGLSTTPAT